MLCFCQVSSPLPEAESLGASERHSPGIHRKFCDKRVPESADWFGSSDFEHFLMTQSCNFGTINGTSPLLPLTCSSFLSFSPTFGPFMNVPLLHGSLANVAAAIKESKEAVTGLQGWKAGKTPFGACDAFAGVARAPRPRSFFFGKYKSELTRNKVNTLPYPSFVLLAFKHPRDADLRLFITGSH